MRNGRPGTASASVASDSTPHGPAGLEHRNDLLDTATSSPLRGFRPLYASRILTAKTPKHRNSTRPPRARAVLIVSRIVLTMSSASRRYSGFFAAILSASSDLTMRAPSPGSDLFNNRRRS